MNAVSKILSTSCHHTIHKSINHYFFVHPKVDKRVLVCCTNEPAIQGRKHFSQTTDTAPFSIPAQVSTV